ncbi:unnamed protein product, partial [Lepidochelys kempii]
QYKGTFNVILPVNAILPSATIFVYSVFHQGRVAADSTSVKVSKCFRNNVKLSFSEKMVLPRSAVCLQVKATPGSLCSVCAVDQSVLLMRPEAELSRASAPSLGWIGNNALNRKGLIHQSPALLSLDCNQGPAELETGLDLVYSMFSYPKEYPYIIRDTYNDPCDGHRCHRGSLGASASPGTSSSPYQMAETPTTTTPPFMHEYYHTYSYAVLLPDLYELLKALAPMQALLPDSRYNTNQAERIFMTFESILSPHWSFWSGASEVTFSFLTFYSAMVVPVSHAFGTEEDVVKNSNEPEGNKAVQACAGVLETFLWSLVPINLRAAELPLTVPDTITDWKAMTFYISEHSGLGISETVSLRTFKPFFVEPALPYSVIRGESFPLKVKVFSYLTQCMGIQLSLKDSGDFEFVQSNVEFTACLCPDLAKTFSWDEKATKLGEVNFTITAGAIEREDVCTENMTVVLETGGKDTVNKPLLVKAEGLPEENTHTSLLCPKGNTTSETITLAVPGDVVPGSERADISTLERHHGNSTAEHRRPPADVRWMQRAEHMVRFAPNVFITRYLEETGQRSNRKLLASWKAHIDGSYSAFGEGHG